MLPTCRRQCRCCRHDTLFWFDTPYVKTYLCCQPVACWLPCITVQEEALVRSDPFTPELQFSSLLSIHIRKIKLKIHVISNKSLPHVANNQFHSCIKSSLFVATHTNTKPVASPHHPSPVHPKGRIPPLLQQWCRHQAAATPTPHPPGDLRLRPPSRFRRRPGPPAAPARTQRCINRPPDGRWASDISLTVLSSVPVVAVQQLVCATTAAPPTTAEAITARASGGRRRRRRQQRI